MGTTSPARYAASQFSGTNQFTNLVPESWVKELLRHFYANFVFKNLVNFKYEKTIKGKGDTIHIRKIGTPTIKNYERNMTTVAEDMTDEEVLFTIDQQKYWHVKIDDLDVADMDIDILNGYVELAAKELAQVVDIYIEGLMIAGADADNVIAGNTSTSPIAITPTNVYATLVAFNEVLIDTNTLESGKNATIVAPTRLISCIRLAPETTHATPLGDKTVRNGDMLGTYAGLDVVPSRRIKPDSAGVYTIVGMTSKEACTFAMKVSKLERNRLGAAGQFGQNIMALYFYGGKVIYPEMLAILTCTISLTPTD